MITAENCRQLLHAIVLQAVKDYFNDGNKRQILSELRMLGADVVIEQLKKHPNEIKARIKRGDD